MFGLLRHTPAATGPLPNNTRIHYCGTCKAIGARYGQLSRFTLNSDIVFLAGLLSAVNGEDTGRWQKALSSYNCFSMPGRNSTLPASLEYAAALNVILAGLKINDNVHDSKSLKWKGIRRLFRSPYHKALLWMKQQGVPAQKMEQYVAELQRREREKIPGTAKEIFDHYARPIAALTALAMRYGSKKQTQQLSVIGYHFGQLIYLLDAYRDREKDARKKQFNPFFLLTEPYSDVYFEKQITAVKNKMETAVRTLQLEAEQEAYFISCLHLNFSIEMNRLNFAGHVYHSCSAQVEKLTLALRWEKSRAVFHRLKQSLLPAQPVSLLKKLKLKYIVPVLAFMAVFISPASAAVAAEQQVANGNAGSASGWLWALAGGTFAFITRDKCCKDTKCKCCSEPCCGKKS